MTIRRKYDPARKDQVFDTLRCEIPVVRGTCARPLRSTRIYGLMT